MASLRDILGYTVAPGAYGVGKAALGNEGLWGSDFKKMPTLSPEQESLLNQILGNVNEGGQLGQGYSQGLSNLQELLNPSSSAYQRFEAPYMKQFQEQTIPGIAERFAGAGPMSGALSSSGFGQALSTAGSQLQTGLAGLKSQLQRQAINDILKQYSGQAGLGLGTTAFGYRAPQQGLIPQLLSSFAQGAGKGIGILGG